MAIFPAPNHISNDKRPAFRHPPGPVVADPDPCRRAAAYRLLQMARRAFYGQVPQTDSPSASIMKEVACMLAVTNRRADNWNFDIGAGVHP